MEITFAWILSQVFTVGEYGLLGATYFMKKRRAVVILDIISMICGIVAYVLLGADLGMLLSVIILLANFYYLWDENTHTAKERKTLHVRDYIVLFLVLVAIGVVTGLTYDGPLSLLSVLATMLYEISIWQKSTKVYKFLGIPVAGCWMIYNGFIWSPFGVICEAGILVASIVGYYKTYKKKRRKVVQLKKMA